MKKIVFVCLFLMGGFLFTGVFENSPSFLTPDDALFDPDGCRRGEAGAWTGACACYLEFDVSGKYCDQPAVGQCETNADCPEFSYCNRDKKAVGRCFLQDYFSPFELNGRRIVFSRSLMNFDSVRNFCASLGNNWRPAGRQDLGCASHGLGCVENEILTMLQNKQGVRGFVWLDRLETGSNAFYVDLNDGNVYTMAQSTAVIAQGMCVSKESEK